MADELLEAVQWRMDAVEQCFNTNSDYDPADLLMNYARLVQALIRLDELDTLRIDKRTRRQHTVESCINAAAIALHIASRVQR